MIRHLELPAHGSGLHELTPQLQRAVAEADWRDGLCTLYLRHTSASLLVQENADPSVLRDLEAWLQRLVPEGDALYTHTAEGSDDMPAHIKTALGTISLALPIIDGQLALGTWQGVFLWEHRQGLRRRELLLHFAP